MSRYSRHKYKWTSTSDSDSYGISKQRWLLRAKAFAQHAQSLPFSHFKSMESKLQSKVGQHKRFWSLIALTSCDGSYEPKHSHSPASLPFSHSQSLVFKLQTKVGQHKRFGSLIALTNCDGSHEPKHSHSPARAFCICIHKVLYSSYKHNWASTKDSASYRIGEQRWLLRS